MFHLQYKKEIFGLGGKLWTSGQRELALLFNIDKRDLHYVTSAKAKERYLLCHINIGKREPLIINTYHSRHFI